jgi:PAP2 superfamily
MGEGNFHCKFRSEEPNMIREQSSAVRPIARWKNRVGGKNSLVYVACSILMSLPLHLQAQSSVPESSATASSPHVFAANYVEFQSTVETTKPAQQLGSIQQRLGPQFDKPVRFANLATLEPSFQNGNDVQPASFQSWPTSNTVTQTDRLTEQSGEIYQPSLREPNESRVNYQLRFGSIDNFTDDMWLLPRTIGSDFSNFWSRESAVGLALGFGVGAALANSNADSAMLRQYHSWARDPDQKSTREFISSTKVLGEGEFLLPIYFGTWGASYLLENPRVLKPIGTWGSKSARGFLVGAPAMIAFQWMTGASRPTETDHGSEWKFLNDNNGVSGHSFMGALPFITAAKMSDRIAVKSVFFAGSVLTPLSRVNDNAHYPSQAILGWWVAYMAATAVDVTDNPERKWHLYPFANATESGVAAEYKW